MTRAVILVLDSLGVGASADAAHFGDSGADTFGHIAEHCARGAADVGDSRRGPLHIPNLCALGLVQAAAASRGGWPAGLPQVAPQGAWGYAVEASAGKDTPSGHWEMAGLPVTVDWGYFPDTVPCFPAALTAELTDRVGLPGILGNCHASGTAIIEQLGEQHISTGKPICYTSADSVFQIAAHETHFGLKRLYAVCEVARKLVDRWNIGRVIARPFVGGAAAAFQRTGNRRDFTTPPPAPTLHSRHSRDIMEQKNACFLLFFLLLNFLYFSMFFYPIFSGFWTSSKLRFVVPGMLFSCFSCCEKVMIFMTFGLPK